MDVKIRTTDVPGVSAAVLTLRAELAAESMRELGSLSLAGRDVQVMEGRDAIWVIVRRPGRGGIAVRAAYTPGGAQAVKRRERSSRTGITLDMMSAQGSQSVEIGGSASDLPTLRITAKLTPVTNLLVPFQPRDIYPLDENDDPLAAQGSVEAAQRGLNSGLIYFHLDEPAFGSVLYFQNLTALNDWFIATRTTPDTAVGGVWPELGYLPPTPAQTGSPPIDPLPAGREVTVSDAIIVFHDDSARNEQDGAKRFLQMLGTAYRQLEQPETEFRDWVARSRMTLADLDTAQEATVSHYGHRYFHPYTDAEYPDIMVQMSLLSAIRNFALWSGEESALADEIGAGLHKFHDRKLKTMRRYLPNVGKDKDKLAVDSWYLYHPLLNLGHLAGEGDARAQRLFTASLDFAIRAARHFDYAWPIQFKVDDFSVIVEARNDDGLGQSDVGGLYAYVMLQAFQLTDEKRYLDEARAAIDKAKGMRFELNYQANLTAWGASACMRLWRVTSEQSYLRQSYVYLASFFHNCAIWESNISQARNYSNFLGVTCLHDGPYMAIYECFDSFAAFERYLKDSGPDLDPAARMLISEYCKYALHRAWFYYPDALPAGALADEQRNGHIDRKLSFPLEDLYHDGQPAGQVGQEIYGAGAAMVFASRTFHEIEGAPFRLFCDHFLMTLERTSATALSFRLDGGDGCRASVSLVRTGRSALPHFVITTASGDRLRAHHTGDDRVEYHVPASGGITLGWG
ncbi:hypothetical protein U1872_18535 [Sphingomonas sp. RB3P16]|uniref:hypothetical protein n=1 Tax=Parasphingomonas frigoris TaxID=3096163 RepID=UPI002FC6A63D